MSIIVRRRRLMSGNELDVSDSLAWEDGLPRPRWDLIETWVASHCDPDAWRGALEAAARQWLAELGPALGGGYETAESDNFLALAPQGDETGRRLVHFGERCRSALLLGAAVGPQRGRRLRRLR